MNDPASQLAETATYCAPNDPKRPGLVGLPDFTTSNICDDDLAVGADMVADAYPDGWFVRIMFDELLDPNVEELIEIIDPDTGMGSDVYSGTLANTQPVRLQCESIGGGLVDVEYDGYYSPSGNAVTWPLGPALVIKPNNPLEVATGKMCQVTINDNVVDKNGEAVPADQRGPFAFKLAPIQPIAISPADGDEIDPLSVYFDNVYVQFNTYVDPDSFCDDGVGMDECEFTFGAELDAGPLYAYTYAPAGAESEFGFGPELAAMAESEYTFAFKQGGKIKDRCGVETTFGAPSVGDLTQVTFTTTAFDLDRTRPGTGDTVSPLRKLSLQFNNVVDLTTLASNEYSIAPAPELATVDSTTFNDGDFLFLGNYQPATQYTFTLNEGATITDAHGVEYTQTGGPLVVTWTTQPIAVTATSPANNGTSVKATTAALTTIGISFNQSMNPASLEPTDYTVTGPGGAAVAFATGAATGCGPTSTACKLNLTSVAPLAPGDYVFTLLANAQLTDVMTVPTTYTQPSARVVNFTVEEAAPPAAPLQCL